MRRLMHSTAMVVLLGLQCFVVLFVALHNWIPLGTLNDVKGASLRVDLSYGRGSRESIKGWAFIQGV